MTVTRTHFPFRIDLWTPGGESSNESNSMPSNTRHLVRGGGNTRGRGRVRRTAWEGLVFHGGLATTGAVIDWVYAGKRQPRVGPYTRLRARLDEIADRVGRSRGPGRPWLWRLRPGRAPKGCWDGWLNPETGEPWPD
jgi:hypothetical protein